MADLRGKQIWCRSCSNKIPPTMRPADRLIFLRESYYGFMIDGVTIDKRLIGTCFDCLAKESEFRRRYTKAVDINHPHLIKKQV